MNESGVAERFGFKRTVCACCACTAFCRRMPGFLVPEDIAPLRAQFGDDSLDALCCASPGALVRQGDGPVFRIPTIVPARRADGSCVFLDADARCSIHAIAPYGCAYFDTHQSRRAGDERSAAGLRAIANAFRYGAGPDAPPWSYGGWWQRLLQLGRLAPAPEELRGLGRHGRVGG